MCVPPCARAVRLLVQPRPRGDAVLHDVPESARAPLPGRRRRAGGPREDRGPAGRRGRRARRRAARPAGDRGARARGLAAPRPARVPRTRISRAPSWSSPPPPTATSTCASSATPRSARCSSTSSTCRRSATSSCPPSRASGRSRSRSRRAAPARRSPSGCAREIAERYGEPYAQLAELLNDIRTWARDTLPTYQDRKVFFESIVHAEPDPIELLRAGDEQAVRDLIAAHIRAAESSRCAGLRASRPSSRAWRNARSARRSPCSARPIRRSSSADGAAAPPRQRDGLPRCARRPLAAAARRRGDGLRGRALQRPRLHGRAHAGRLGPALRGHAASGPRAGPSSRGRSCTGRSRRSG